MKKILLLGDSIRRGYDASVAKMLDGVAEVYYPAENCRFAAYILRYLPDWRQKLELDESLDLVHLNAGLWDVLRMLDGEPLFSLTAYREYIDRIFCALKKMFPKARLVFATSTPVREHLFTGPYKRYNADTERYNAAAVEVALSHGAEINDLYALVSEVPESYYSDMTHLYTPEGTRLLSEAVCASIERVLDIRGKGYDEVAPDERVEVIGI